ncbi:MAG TPA: outer membrane beta-barrel protein [Bacteroidales bacterium]|nr:outer membrane beta-barrel protein [Bacteroidales bacterium]
MKQFCALILAFLLSAAFSVSYPQKLSVGFHSGMNLSDIHGNDYSGKWKFKPGPLEGIFIDYSITRDLGVKTGVDFLTVYYEHHPYTNYFPVAYPASSYYLADIFWYYPVREMMNFSFLTLPAQVRITVPSRPQLNLAAGVYYSFVLDSNFDYGYSNPGTKKNDLGFIYSAGIAYPMSGRLDALFNVRYMTGRREFFENDGYRHGSADFAFGLAYKIIPGKSDNNNRSGRLDSLNKKIYLTYRGGVNFSWNSCNTYHDNYSLYTGPSLGFNMGFELSPGTYFRTGLSFERQGYALRDSSDSFHRYFIDGDASYDVRTRVSTDYLVIPALLEFYFGNARLFYFNTGPYLGIKLNARCAGTAMSGLSSDGIYKLDKTTVYDDLEQIIKDNDFGWVAGGGLTLPLSGNRMLDIGLQFRQSFIEVYDTSKMPEETRPEHGDVIIRNSSLALQIGLRVPIYK